MYDLRMFLIVVWRMVQTNKKAPDFNLKAGAKIRNNEFFKECCN